MYILDKQAPFIYIFVYLLQSEPSQSEIENSYHRVTQFHVIYRTIAKVTYLNSCCRIHPIFFNILSQLCAFSLTGAFHIKYQIDLSFVFLYFINISRCFYFLIGFFFIFGIFCSKVFFILLVFLIFTEIWKVFIVLGFQGFL